MFHFESLGICSLFIYAVFLEPLKPYRGKTRGGFLPVGFDWFLNQTRDDGRCDGHQAIGWSERWSQGHRKVPTPAFRASERCRLRYFCLLKVSFYRFYHGKSLLEEHVLFVRTTLSKTSPEKQVDESFMFSQRRARKFECSDSQFWSSKIFWC